MPNIKPMPKSILDTLGEFSVHPKKLEGHYAESLHANKFFIKPPNLGSPDIDVDLIALQNEQEYAKMRELQEEMVENSKREAIINSNRIEELYRVQAEIRSSFIRANNFFKDCDEKTKYSETTCIQQKELHKGLKTAISDFKENIEILTEFRKTIKKVTEQYEPYESLVKQVVVAAPDYFKSVKDCMDKCDNIMLTQEEVCELQKQKQQELQNLRLKMIKMSKDNKLEVLGLMNTLHDLEKVYEKLKSESIMKEDIIAQTKDHLVQVKSSENAILDEVSIIHRILCRRRGESPVFNRTTIKQQFDFIRDEIQIIRGVIKECNKTGLEEK